MILNMIDTLMTAIQSVMLQLEKILTILNRKILQKTPEETSGVGFIRVIM